MKIPHAGLSIALTMALVALQVGCPVADDDDDDSDDGSCTGVEGVLSVCVCWDQESGDPVDDAILAVRQPTDDSSMIEALTSEGCVDVVLPVGTWEWSARDSVLSCVTPFEEVTIEPCATVEQKVELWSWCTVGR